MVEQAHELQAAREALEAHAWEQAVERYSAVDRAHPLAPDDLEALAEAAFWAGRSAKALEAGQRAHAGFVAESRQAEAASAALGVGQLHFLTGGTAVASAWLSRAQRLLADLPETVAHAELAWAESQAALLFKAYEQAMDRAREVEVIATRLGAQDLVALGRSTQGLLLVHTDDPRAGMRLLDEAAAMAMTGELGTFASSEIVCEMTVSCLRLADHERAGEWLDSIERAGRRIACFPGCCRTHRATVLRHRGEWAGAYEHAERAQAELAGHDVLHEAMALVEIGELHRCRGQLTMAEGSFVEAYEKGWSPQPGLALVLLRRGDVDAAKTMMRRVVDHSAEELATLVELLPAHAEIAIAAGDGPTAAAAADRLTAVASSLGTSTASAASDELRGVVLAEQGDLSGAATVLETSVQSWQRARTPYRAARARMRLATVLAELGDHGSATLELRAARAVFDRLGAVPDALEAARRLGDATPSQAHRTFMFTDIVDSTVVLTTIGDAAWHRLRQWHDREVTTIVGEHRGEVVKETGDGFFAAFEDPRLAVECAIAIQRVLEHQRRTQGYSPAVRIGLHLGSALTVEEDYAGRDVVIASRIAAAATADQVLVSAEVAKELGPDVDLRPVAPLVLKGIPDPVAAAEVAWR